MVVVRLAPRTRDDTDVEAKRGEGVSLLLDYDLDPPEVWR
jgi:hypothetical protein